MKKKSSYIVYKSSLNSPKQDYLETGNSTGHVTQEERRSDGRNPVCYLKVLDGRGQAVSSPAADWTRWR